MKSIKKVSALVKEILEEIPETRNSDMRLYYQVCYRLNLVALGKPFGYVIMNLKTLNLPSIETVGRARRKLQRKHPELMGNDKVEEMRIVQEEKFRNYARAVNV